MKRCPQCNRVETDEALKFCRLDGTLLVEALGSKSESATMAFPASRPSEEITTGRLTITPSIAVLPFVNMSADPENEYFCDGLAEELLNALAKIDDLKVAARTSSFSFKGKNLNVKEIGDALHVKTILEGSVRRASNRMRITVQLVNASDGYHLWSERYDRELQDIFEVQDEITLAVVNALKVKLLGDEKQAVLKRYTRNAEAYQLYLHGRFFFAKRTPESFKKAIEYFEQAIQLDSEYALAFSGLADCYHFIGFYEVIPPAEAKKQSRAAAFKALELDDTLAETHTSFAFYRATYEWDFSTSEKHFKKAIALNPTYALTYHLYSTIFSLQGHDIEAIAAEKHAIELEPFAAIFNAALGWWYYLARRNDEAIAQSLKTIEIAPNHFFAHWVLGLAYGQAGSYNEAIATLGKAVELTGFNQHIKGDLGRVYAMSGQHDEAVKVLAELTRLAVGEYVSPVNMAKLYLGLSESKQAFEWLEKACEERSIKLTWFMRDPALDKLRSDLRFKDLLRRVGLTH